MLLLAADENFDGDILHGLLRRQPQLDLVRLQDVGLAGADDRVVLDWAARQGRILLTHGAATMVGFAYERVRAGLPMPGVFEESQRVSTGQAIESVLLLAEARLEDEWDGRIVYPPL